MKALVNPELKQRYAPAMKVATPEQLARHIKTIDARIDALLVTTADVKTGKNDQFSDAECEQNMAELQAMREAVRDEQYSRGLKKRRMIIDDEAEEKLVLESDPFATTIPNENINIRIAIAAGVFIAVAMLGTGLGVGLTI